MKEPTKADLATAVARLTEENAGLRELLAAVSAYAELPRPASHDNRTYGYELERRADAIAIWANGDREDMAPDVYALVIQDRAKHLREEAARPVRYEVRAEPAQAESDAGVSEECTDYDPNYKLHGCELDAGHDGPHRDLVGHEWTETLKNAESNEAAASVTA